MNAVLWILQIALGLKFVSVAYTHGIGDKRTTMQPGMQKMGAVARPLMTTIGVISFLGGVGLILPAATGILTWLTPLAAALLALFMLGGCKFHLRCRDTPNIVVGLVLFALAAFVCYRRWVMAPL